MKVTEIMHENVVTCTTTTPVATAAAMMKEHGIGLVPVLHAGTKFLAGVVTDRDLCLHVLAAKAQPEKFLVNQCMSVAVTYCKPADTVETALQKMAEAQVRRLPIVDKGILVGVLGIADILRENAAPGGKILAALHKIYAPEGARKSKKAA